MSREHFEKLACLADADKDGIVTLDDWIAVWTTRASFTREQIRTEALVSKLANIFEFPSLSIACFTQLQRIHCSGIRKYIKTPVGN